MLIKLEFISTKEPKWHIYYKKQPNSNEGDVIVYKSGKEEHPLSNEITGCESYMGDINQYLTFFGKVMINLNTAYHLMPFKNNNISKEEIMDKIISKVEEIVKYALKNGEEFSGICGICPWNCRIEAPQKDKCREVNYLKAIYSQFGINYRQEIPAELIESTMAADMAAESIVENNTAMDIIQQQEQQAIQTKEKEELIAEAYKLTGRVEALKLMSDFGNVSSLLLLKNIKENKIYKNMQGIETWENYCKSEPVKKSL